MQLREGFTRLGNFDAPAQWQQPLARELRELGTGMWPDGYVRIVNPLDILPVFRLLVPEAPDALPVAVTAFGDVVFIDQNSVLFAAVSRHGVLRELYLSGVAGFEMLCSDRELLDEDIPDVGYTQGVERLGIPAIDECFGYSLLLALGGSPRPEKLERVKLTDHLQLIVKMAGPIA